MDWLRRIWNAIFWPVYQSVTLEVTEPAHSVKLILNRYSHEGNAELAMTYFLEEDYSVDDFSRDVTRFLPSSFRWTDRNRTIAGFTDWLQAQHKIK